MKSFETSIEARLKPGTTGGDAVRQKPDPASTASDFRPWHFFVLSALLAATVAIVVVRPSDPAALILLSAAVGAAAITALALYRTLWPLAAADFQESVAMAGGRTRAAVEREKTLVLRSIKELEFDRAMGKIAEQDFEEMAGRLRRRAISLMRQLDADPGTYRELIERELEARLRRQGMQNAERRTQNAERETLNAEPVEAGAGAAPTCSDCGTLNDDDARFCKGCGKRLE